MAFSPQQAVAEFEAFADRQNIALTELRPRNGFEAMLAFFESMRPANCVEPNGDMLLYQWGTYDWGEGEHFELDLTRQFVEEDKEGDDAISQLHLTFRFPPSTELRATGSGNRGCDTVNGVAAFKKFVFERPEFIALADEDPPNVSLHHELV